MMITLFEMVRDVDVSGVSGTGTVADGVIWPDGTVTLRWRGELVSTAVYPDMDTVRQIHGHGGCTRFRPVAQINPLEEGEPAWSA